MNLQMKCKIIVFCTGITGRCIFVYAVQVAVYGIAGRIGGTGSCTGNIVTRRLSYTLQIAFFTFEGVKK